MGCSLWHQRPILRNCTGVFTRVSASATFAAPSLGWDLRNSLDSTPGEGSWNNPPVQAITFSQVQAKGFKSVGIPGRCASINTPCLSDSRSDVGIPLRRFVPHMECQYYMNGQSGDGG